MQSLRTRLIISHIFPILVIIPVIGVILVYLLETQFLISNSTTDFVSQANLIAGVAGIYQGMWFDTREAQTFVSEISSGVTANVQLLDPSGRLIVSSNANDASKAGQIFDASAVQQILNGKATYVITYNGSQIYDVLVPVTTSNYQLMGFVRVENPFAVAYQRSMNLRLITMVVLGVGLLLGILLALILANELEKSLSRVTNAVVQISERKQMAPLKEDGPREVRLLVRTVNNLVERLETMEDSRRKLLANLVHEIGTPLGALRSGAQALLNGADEDPELRKELLLGIDEELARLHSLLNELSHLNDQVFGTLELNLRPVQLSEWLPRTIAPWVKAAEEKHIRWTTDLAPDLPEIQMDPDRLAQVIGNLLSNAIRYSPEGGQIGFTAATDPQNLIIQVKDSGPGIFPDEQRKIFTPFFRGKAARRFSSGMGLGLSIAKDLIEAHGGELLIDSKPDEGACFSIHIPLSHTKEPGNLLIEP